LLPLWQAFNVDVDPWVCVAVWHSPTFQLWLDSALE
jgi:hypothetical protein